MPVSPVPVAALTTNRPRRIVTHRAPDADAHVSAYLAERFLFPGESVEVVFVSRTARRAALESADCVVDVGNQFDPARLRFDHKPPAFADRNQHCATTLLWDYLRQQGKAVAHLADLVAVVHQGDYNPPLAASPELKTSRESGVHAQVARTRRAHPTDDLAQYRMVQTWLNAHCAPA